MFEYTGTGMFDLLASPKENDPIENLCCTYWDICSCYSTNLLETWAPLPNSIKIYNWTDGMPSKKFNIELTGPMAGQAKS